MYTIYGIFSKKDCKVKYVGSTSRNVKTRIKEHFKNSRDKTRPDYQCKNYQWLRTLDYEDIDYIVFKIVDTEEEANRVERNIVLSLGMEILDEGILKNTCTGGKNGYEYYNQEKFRKNPPRSRKVKQYDWKGNLLNTFDSIAEAERQTGIGNPHISACCRGNRKQAGRFVWRYEKDNFYTHNISGVHGIRRINMYSLEGNFIRTYESAKDAANDVGLTSTGNLISACKGKQRTYGGYLWRYEGDSL